MGFVHAVYPADGFRSRVQAFAASLAQLPREPLGIAKLGIDAAVTADRTASRDFDRVAQSLLLLTDHHKEKISRFVR